MNSNTMETQERIWDKKYLLIMGIALLGMMGGSLLGPVLPALAKPFNVADNRVGLVLAVYTAFTAFSMPFIGQLIDKFGSKKIVIPCLLVNGLAGSFAAFAPNFTFLLVLRGFQGIGIAGLLPVAMTLVGEFYSGQKKVQAMGYMSSLLAIGGVMAPVIGGGLAVISWKLTFLFYSLSIPLAAAIVIWLPDIERKRNTSLLDFIPNYINILKNRAFLTLAGCNFFISFLMISIVTFVPIYLSRNLGMNEGITGLILSVQGVAGAVMGAMVRHLSLHFKFKWLLFTGFLISSTAFTLIASTTSLAFIVFSLYLMGSGLGLVMPMSNAMVTEVVSGSLGAGTALYNTMNFAGQAASPILLGIVFGAFGLTAVFWCAAGIAVFSAAGILLAATLYFFRDPVF